MLTLTLVQKIAVWTIPVLLAITLHEAAHAWAANKCGDTTAKQLGRLSINPLKHIDLIGTILVPIIIGILSDFQFIFGWAKPVPVRWNRLRRPRLDTAIVGAAGPVANLIMALLWAACMKFVTVINPERSIVAIFILLAAQAGLIVNVLLASLNLLPIPPLDGSRIITSMLSFKQEAYYRMLEPYGFLILIILIFTGILRLVVQPMVYGILYIIDSIFGL